MLLSTRKFLDLVKGISKAIKNKKGGFLPMLFGRLAASILENARPGVIRPGEGIIIARKNF